MSEVLSKVGEIEAEMRRIGFWSGTVVRTPDDSQLYGGVPFEQWLQFVFLPAVSNAARSGDFRKVPPYRVGLAALRNWDYHSVVDEALPLVRLCNELERLIESERDDAA